MNTSFHHAPMASEPPRIPFPGGYVQFVNPRYPIEAVWSDLLFLEPNGELPTHKHKSSSSLLMCVSGCGEISVGGNITLLKKGVCVFIPARSEHCVKAASTESLCCLSINEGIIKPGVGTDIEFTRAMDETTAEIWRNFSLSCARKAEDYRQQLKNEESFSHNFEIDL